MAKKAGKAKARARKKSAKKAAKKGAKKTVKRTVKKATRKAKARKVAVKKTRAAKKAAKPIRARKVAKRAAAPPPAAPAVNDLVDAAVPHAAPPKAKPPVLSGASQAAVTGCVKKYMDWKHPGWDADLQGETRKLVADYHETPQSIPLIFNYVRNCLAGSGFTFVTTAALVQACVTGTVSDMEYAIYKVTTLIQQSV
jgi:hypothetical protein